VVLIFVAHRVAPFRALHGRHAGAAVCALGRHWSHPRCSSWRWGPAGLFFPGFYVTASGKMGEDIRVPPTIIAAGSGGRDRRATDPGAADGGHGGPRLLLAVAGATLTLTVAALMSLRRMRV
jgi:MFS transporter, FHS family, glucose/mannose:H+ symporter